MEELTEVITAAECHPHQCNVFVYSSSKGTIRLCDMRAAALCDRHSKCEYFKSVQCLFRLFIFFYLISHPFIFYQMESEFFVRIFLKKKKDKLSPKSCGELPVCLFLPCVSSVQCQQGLVLRNHWVM